MLFGVVCDRRFFHRGDDARARGPLEHGSRNTLGGSGGDQTIAESVFGRGLQGLPFLSGFGSDHAPSGQIARSGRRKNSMIQVQRSLALAVQRVHRNDPQPVVVANKNRSYGMIDRPRRMDPWRKPPDGNARTGVVAIWQRRRVEPTSAAGVEQPAPVVIGSPPPRLETVPRPAEGRVPNPLSVGKGRPAVGDTEGPPAITIGSAAKPGTVGVEAAEARGVIGRTRILHGGGGGRRNGVDLAGDPVVKFVWFGDAANLC